MRKLISLKSSSDHWWQMLVQVVELMQPPILLVEENPFLLSMAEHALAPAGYDVTATTHSGDAVDFFDMVKPKVVVTDLIMTDADSLDTIAEFKRRRPDTSVVAISDSGYLLELATKAGADFVLTKPFAPEDLMFLIDAALMMPEIDPSR